MFQVRTQSDKIRIIVMSNVLKNKQKICGSKRMIKFGDKKQKKRALQS